MDLLYDGTFQRQSIYAFAGRVGEKIELRFSVDWSEDRSRFGALGKREFPGAALLTAGTLWAKLPARRLLFTPMHYKIHRYNPLNKEVKALDASLGGGKRITMLRMTNNGSQLIAGVEGAVLPATPAPATTASCEQNRRYSRGTCDIMIREN